MRQMVEEHGVKDDISVSTMSRLPEIFTVEKPEVDEQQLKADLMSVLEKALAGYDAMRCTEGAAMEQDLRSRGNTIRELVARVADLVSPEGLFEADAPGIDGAPAEVILALSGDVEGETTSFYIYRQISQYGVKVSSLARGLGFGDNLEYADELTLGRSIVNRQIFKP